MRLSYRVCIIFIDVSRAFSRVTFTESMKAAFLSSSSRCQSKGIFGDDDIVPSRFSQSM
jgi:hypothetical protein